MNRDKLIAAYKLWFERFLKNPEQFTSISVDIQVAAENSVDYLLSLVAELESQPAVQETISGALGA